jgi:hypothetical protein
VSAEDRPAEVLEQILKVDQALYRRLMLFLRSAALETGVAVDAGRRPPGTRLTDGRVALDVPHEGVIVYYVPDPAEREMLDVVRGDTAHVLAGLQRHDWDRARVGAQDADVRVHLAVWRDPRKVGVVEGPWAGAHVRGSHGLPGEDSARRRGRPGD